MANKVVVNVDSLPKDAPVEVLYLGEFPNGGTHELTDEQVATYEAVSQTKFPASGYLFGGEPKTDVQKKAAAENAKAVAEEKTMAIPEESKVV